MALPAGRYGVTKNQLLKIKKLPMNTIKLIEELTEKFDLLGTAAFKNSTSVVTQSTDLVESGAVYDAVQDVYKVNGVVGAKNRLSYTLDELKTYNQNGTWNGNVYTIYGITYTINSDNSITINGTQNGTDYGSDLYLCGANTNDGRILVSPFLDNQKLSVGVAVDYEKLRIGFWYYDTNKSYTGVTNTIPNGEKQVVLNPPSNAVYTTQYIRVTLNSTVSNLTIYPMLYAVDDTDDTYQPHAETNRELTVNKADNSVIGTVENGANPTKAYAVNEFMVRDGAFCQVTVPVTTSSTWTEGSNYTKKSIAEVLQSLMS